MATRLLDSQMYDPRYARCRDIRHWWAVIRWTGNKRTLICEVCTMRKDEILDGAFRVVFRQYSPPKGYNWVGVKYPVRIIRAQLKRQAKNIIAKAELKTLRLRIVKGGKP
jgi:hypothetical protein